MPAWAGAGTTFWGLSAIGEALTLELRAQEERVLADAKRNAGT